MHCRIYFIIFLLSIGGSNTLAQADFTEGTLVYKIDTIRRLETQPQQYIATHFNLFKKGDLIRAETVNVNQYDSTDIKRFIQIRNQKGIYTIIETESSISVDTLAETLSISKDSLLKVFPLFNGFALFNSYEEEKLNRSNAALQGRIKIYTAKKNGQESTLLNLKADHLVITSSDKVDSTYAKVTQEINAPVGLFFEPLLKIRGTPLQFTNSLYGRYYQYTIESINIKPLPDELFQIDPKLILVTGEQLIQEINDLKNNL